VAKPKQCLHTTPHPAAFLHRKNNRQTGKKEASGSVVPLRQQEAHMLWKNLFLMEKEQTNQSQDATKIFGYDTESK
jgi:hypothetical protein